MYKATKSKVWLATLFAKYSVDSLTLKTFTIPNILILTWILTTSAAIFPEHIKAHDHSN